MERLRRENERLKAGLQKALDRAREQADLWRDGDYGDSEHADWWDKEVERLEQVIG